MGNNVNKKEDTSYITLLSVISAIAVVFLHTNRCFWDFKSDADYWFSANIIECLFYFAVPIFFMISGATLIDYRERYSTKEYFIKRIKKTVIPFIVWSIVSLIYDIFLERTVNTGDVNLSYILGRFLYPGGVYWFFAPLFTMYLIIPILSYIPKEKRNKIFFWGAVASFTFNGIVPFIQNNVYFFPSNMMFCIGNEYTFYILAGYLLRKIRLSRKKEILIYIFAVVGLLLHVTGTYRLSVNAGDVIETYKGYNNVPCVLYSLGIFVFFRNYGNKIMNGLVGNIIKKISGYTFGIYLIHIYAVSYLPFLISMILGNSEVNTVSTSLLYRITAPFVIIPICVLIIFLLRKIPVIRHIVP